MKSRKAFLLRLNPGLYEELEVWASADLRSVNAQIEFLLTDAVRRHRKELPVSDDKTKPDIQEQT